MPNCIICPESGNDFHRKLMERGSLMDRLYDFYEKYRKSGIVKAARRKIGRFVLRGFRVAAVTFACYGWWGVIYPELTLLPSTYEIVYESEYDGQETNAQTKAVQKSRDVVEWNFDNRIYREILEADPEQIRYKSRILSFLESL